MYICIDLNLPILTYLLCNFLLSIGSCRIQLVLAKRLLRGYSLREIQILRTFYGSFKHKTCSVIVLLNVYCRHK